MVFLRKVLLAVLCAVSCGSAWGEVIESRGRFVVSAGLVQRGCYVWHDAVLAEPAGLSQSRDGVVQTVFGRFWNFEGDAEKSRVRGRYVFYNNSSWDRKSGQLNRYDDLAIATDKQALRPGDEASFANFVSYEKGVNGIMVDLSGVESPSELTLQEFRFATGNAADAMTESITPIEMSVRRSETGDTRVSFAFADGAIRNRWLKTTVLATQVTGLPRDDVFYFGSAVGNAGVDPNDAKVGVKDAAIIQSESRKTGRVTIESRFDVNRDGKVDTSDVLVAFNAITGLEWTEWSRFSMSRVAESFGLSPDDLDFREWEALAFIEIEPEPIDFESLVIDFVMIASGELYLELDEEDFEIVYATDLKVPVWTPVSGVGQIVRCGKGWHLHLEHLADALFFRVAEKER